MGDMERHVRCEPGVNRQAESAHLLFLKIEQLCPFSVKTSELSSCGRDCVAYRA